MRGFVSKHLSTFLVAAVTAMVTGGGAAVAAGGINADTVDGKHAVGAGAKVAARAGKLVATNSAGYLPNNIVGKPPNADTLDALDSTAFWRKSEAVDAGTFGGTAPTGFWKKGESVDAGALGGTAPSGFWKKSETVDAGTLGGVAASSYTQKSQLSAAGTVNSSTNPVDWTKLKNVPTTLLDGDDGQGLSTWVQYNGTVLASASSSVSTHSWPKSWLVTWQARPTGPGRLHTSVDIEDQGDFYTYIITVTNRSAVTVQYELRGFRLPF